MTALRRLLSTAAAGASRRPRPVWTPPEAPAHKFDPVRLQETLDRLPYFVGRTPVGRNLPVYIDYKNGGSRVITIVRRIDGSQQALADELKAALPGAEVKVRPEMQQVVVKGDHVGSIRAYLTHRGF